MDDSREFAEQGRREIEAMGDDASLRDLSRQWMDRAARHKYSYHFRWMGRPIIQIPQDILALQEIIWETRPDVIVETGIARGGSAVFYASMLHLLGGDGYVVGIDCEIRTHNRAAIEAHPMAGRIRLIEASSVEDNTVRRVSEMVAGAQSVLVALDSNHTHDHVLRELELYAPLVTKGSYLVVFDTAVEDMDPGLFPDRPWGRGNNPKTAVQAFLAGNDRFVVDREI